MKKNPENKLQHKLYHGIEDKYKSDLKASLPMSQPGNGHRITHLNSQDLAVSVQGLANTDPLASAWLTVNPSYDLNKMSDATFNTAFHTRMMFPVMQSRKYCTCGATIDSMGSHFLTCPSMHVRSKMRNPAHKQLDVTMSDPTSNYVQPYKLQKAADSARKIKSDYFTNPFASFAAAWGSDAV